MSEPSGDSSKLSWFEVIALLVLGAAIILWHFRHLLLSDIERQLWGISISADPMSTLFYTYDTVWEAEHGCLRHNVLGNFPFGIFGTPPITHFLSLPAAVMIFIYAATKKLVMSWNIAVMVIFFVNYLLSYFAFKRMSSNRWGAVMASVLVSFSAYAYARSWAHLTMTVLFTFPWFLYSFSKLQETTKLRYAALAGLCFGINIINSAYYGYMTIWMAIAILTGYLVTVPKQYLQLQRIKANAACALIAVLAATPFIYASFLAPSNGFTPPDAAANYGQNLEEIRSASARPSDYVLPNVNNEFFGDITGEWIQDPMNLRHRWSDELPIYIGALPALFLLWTLISSLTGRATWVTSARKHNNGLYTAVLAVIFSSFLLSLPDHINVLGYSIAMPNEFLRHVVPFRSYARFGIVCLTGIAALMALTWPYWRYGRILAATVIAACIFESTPKQWLMPADYDHGYIAYLKQRPERVIMRFEAQNVRLRRIIDLERLLADKQTIHGFINYRYGFTEQAGLNDQSPIHLGHLAQMGVELLLVNGHYTPGTKNRSYVTKIADFPDADVEIWKLTPGPDQRITELLKPYVEAALANACHATPPDEAKTVIAKMVDLIRS